jgi:hypothetical protein
MRLASATDLAIACALKAGTLELTERPSRFEGETVFEIADAFGLIEVHLTAEERAARVAAIAEKVAA